jgi:4-hydroxy-4-methyl-2-oxoglutarate aldolase
MSADDLSHRFEQLTTAHVADACLRIGAPVRCAPAGTRPTSADAHVAGRVLPARHAGSVDVFLEALEAALAGDVLVVDNAGRLDEACVGDLIVLEALTSDVSALIVWGLHRDTADLAHIGCPVWSLGSLPTGPAGPRDRPADALSRAQIGDFFVDATDYVFADIDGAVFVAADRAQDALTVAEGIRDTERKQAERVRAGTTLRDQLDFREYLRAKEADPSLTFRAHLRSRGGAVEE